MSAPMRGRPKWLSKILLALQWLILLGGSAFIAVMLFVQTGASSTTIAVTLALIAYIVYFIWRQTRIRRAVAWNNKGFELLRLKRYEEAQESFNQALKLNPQFMRAWYGTGLCYMWLEHYTEALLLFDRVLTFFPNDPYVLQSKANTLFSQLRTHEALAVATKSLSILEQNEAAWNIKTLALIRLNCYEEALADLNRALTWFPTFDKYWHNQASLLYDDLHRYDEALAVCNEAISRGVALAVMWAIKGDVLRALGQQEDAIAAYRHALELATNDVFGWSARGRALMGFRRYDEALAAFDEALALTKTSHLTWRKKAEVLRALDRGDEAREAEQRADELDR